VQHKIVEIHNINRLFFHLKIRVMAQVVRESFVRFRPSPPSGFVPENRWFLTGAGGKNAPTPVKAPVIWGVADNSA